MAQKWARRICAYRGRESRLIAPSIRIQAISCKKPTKHLPPSLKRKRDLSRLVVTRMPQYEQASKFPSGRFHAGGVVLSCALGRAGISRVKREGDRATPAGTFRLLGGFFRPDKVLRQAWALPMAEIKLSDGWCDDPASPSYNRRVALPCCGSHEKLWRRDRLYDFVVVLGYNIHPRCKFRGSAIFLHCAREDFAPTEGCVALSIADLRRLLRKAVLIIR